MVIWYLCLAFNCPKLLKIDHCNSIVFTLKDVWIFIIGTVDCFLILTLNDPLRWALPDANKGRLRGTCLDIFRILFHAKLENLILMLNQATGSHNKGWGGTTEGGWQGGHYGWRDLPDFRWRRWGDQYIPVQLLKSPGRCDQGKGWKPGT